MIGYLRGEILDSIDGRLLVGIQTGTNGDRIGYAVTIPQNPSYLGWVSGKGVELFIHTHVREDALDLYGFGSKAEKELFLALLSVTGIGPKGAIGILSKIDPSSLIQAILDGDRDALTQMPGIGKKTAERVVLELADPIRKKMDAGLFSGHFMDQSERALAGKNKSGTGVGSVSGLSSATIPIFQEAKAALVGLGYREQDVTLLLKQVIADSEVPPSRTEDLVKSALRQLV